jgi:hypothetical protein
MMQFCRGRLQVADGVSGILRVPLYAQSHDPQMAAEALAVSFRSVVKGSSTTP